MKFNNSTFRAFNFTLVVSGLFCGVGQALAGPMPAVPVYTAPQKVVTGEQDALKLLRCAGVSDQDGKVVGANAHLALTAPDSITDCNKGLGVSEANAELRVRIDAVYPHD